MADLTLNEFRDMSGDELTEYLNEEREHMFGDETIKEKTEAEKDTEMKWGIKLLRKYFFSKYRGLRSKKCLDSG